MKSNTLSIILVIVVIGVGIVLYALRPVKAPSEDINQAVAPLENKTDAKELKIASGESKVRFEIDEMLRGSPNHVVGETGEVAGSVAVLVNPATVTLGEVKINARTLKTDNDQRNGALGRFILQSEDAANEFIVFSNSTVSGLPSQIELGKPFTFSVTGDLLIKGVKKQVTFTGTGTLSTTNEFSGTASTTVAYKDFGLSVPNLPFIAEVGPNVLLTISFVAR